MLSKKILHCILIAVLFLGIAGCGVNDGDIINAVKRSYVPGFEDKTIEAALSDYFELYNISLEWNMESQSSGKDIYTVYAVPDISSKNPFALIYGDGETVNVKSLVFEIDYDSKSRRTVGLAITGDLADYTSGGTVTGALLDGVSKTGSFSVSGLTKCRAIMRIIYTTDAASAAANERDDDKPISLTPSDSLTEEADNTAAEATTADASSDGAGTRSFADKLLEKTEWVLLRIHWYDETVTTFERSDLVWTMHSRNGGTSEVLPDISRNGSIIEIRFPTTSRVYYLYDDYTGIFGEERFTWSSSHKDRDSIVESGEVGQLMPSVTQPAPSDTQPTPTYTQSAPGNSIVGRWEGRDEYNLVTVYDFKLDNSYTMTKPYSAEIGTYEIDGSKLTLTQVLGVIVVETGKNMTYTYTRHIQRDDGVLYLDNDRFEWAPLVPPPTPPQKMSDDDYYDILIEIRRLESLRFSDYDHASQFFRYASICLLACKLVDDYRLFPVMQSGVHGYYYDEINAASYGLMALNSAVLWKTWWNDGDTISPAIRVPKYDKQEIILFLSLLPPGVSDYVWSENYSFLIE